MSKKFALGLIFAFSMIFSSQLWAQDQVRATYYANKFHNRKTASGEVYKRDVYSCAYNQLPLGTYLLVKNSNNGKEVIVKVNDRMGSRSKGRIDLSYVAANDLDIVAKGAQNVEIIPLDATALALKRNDLLVDAN